MNVIMQRSEGLGVPLGGSRGLGSPSRGLWGAWGCKIHCAQKSYYTEQFDKYDYKRDKHDTAYNTPTPYDPYLLNYLA